MVDPGTATTIHGLSIGVAAAIGGVIIAANNPQQGEYDSAKFFMLLAVPIVAILISGVIASGVRVIPEVSPATRKALTRSPIFFPG